MKNPIILPNQMEVENNREWIQPRVFLPCMDCGINYDRDGKFIEDEETAICVYCGLGVENPYEGYDYIIAEDFQDPLQ